MRAFSDEWALVWPPSGLRRRGVITMYYIALFFLSGQMAPLALFPPAWPDRGCRLGLPSARTETTTHETGTSKLYRRRQRGHLSRRKKSQYSTSDHRLGLRNQKGETRATRSENAAPSHSRPGQRPTPIHVMTRPGERADHHTHRRQNDCWVSTCCHIRGHSA